jgi:FMN phosphatase YigB (HAD superfamily)
MARGKAVQSLDHAVQKLGMPPAAVLHVGDDRLMDVRGAQAAGLSALLLKRTARAAKAGQITSLGELCGSGEVGLQS